VGNGDLLFGEVTREFEHVVTGAAMYKVCFGGVLGVQAVPKACCRNTFETDVPTRLTLQGSSDQSGGGSKSDDVVVGTQDNTFTLTLPEYLGGAVSEEDVADPDWEAEFADWRGKSDSGNSDWVMSDDEVEHEVVLDSALDAPDIPFESLQFEHRFAPEHWEDISTRCYLTKCRSPGQRQVQLVVRVAVN
jgi:hypothetical protein